MTSRRPGFVIARRIRKLDPVRDADEIVRLSLVCLHGNPRLLYTMFTVAFMKQVAVPTMARILYRKGNGDIMVDPGRRNDDTLLFFVTLFDHGPTSKIGRTWIERLNAIHANFPLRNKDSLYTLATLTFDTDTIATDMGASIFTETELEAQWQFWATVARLQHIQDIPTTRAQMRAWADNFEEQEYAPSEDGKHVTAALIESFAERVLPRMLRPYGAEIIAAVSPARLREVHDLPEPRPAVAALVRTAMGAYLRTAPLRLVDPDRSFVAEFGVDRYGERSLEEIGYQRHTRSTA